MSHPSICVGDLTTIKKNTKYEKNAFKICVRFRFCTNLTPILCSQIENPPTLIQSQKKVCFILFTKFAMKTASFARPKVIKTIVNCSKIWLNIYLEIRTITDNNYDLHRLYCLINVTCNF